MAGFTTAIPLSFGVEVLQGLHNFTITTGNAFAIALGKTTVTGTYGAATTNYSTLTGNTDENTGTGYSAGGYAITAANNITPLSSGTTAYTTPGVNPSWTGATLTTTGCIMYNTTNANRAVYVGSFGGSQTVTGGTLTLLMPVNAAATALIQIGGL